MTIPGVAFLGSVYAMTAHTNAGARKAKPYTKTSARVSERKSYCQIETAAELLKFSHDAKLLPAPMQKTSVAASHTGPYKSGFGAMSARNGVGGRNGHSAARTRAATSAASTSKQVA